MKINSSIFVGFLLCFAFTFSSCDEDSPSACGLSATFSNQTASGQFYGTPFTVADGSASDDSFEPNQLRFSLYGKSSTDPCDVFLRPDSTLIFTVPNEVGVYELSADRTFTFNISTNNSVDFTATDCGFIEITSITSSSVSGKMNVEFDSNNKMDGTFTVDYCD